MMRWVRDLTGRFPERPHYDAAELDNECETLVSAFLKERHGVVRYPISTSDLTVLAEQLTSDLDMGADLSEEGDDIEGVTVFWPDQKPAIRIDVRLAGQAWRENRLRTTLTHEMSHVKFHAFLWATRAMQGSFFGNGSIEPARCLRGTILGAKQTDWMEWQAGYASGAMLMPISALQAVVIDVFGRGAGLHVAGTSKAESLLAAVQEAFLVSRDAARVRLLQKGMLSENGESRASLIVD